jgi:DNA repair exonuclease SbcCD nuclease subunit
LTVTAIHTADFHLDRNFGFPWIDRVERRRKDLFDNFQRIIDYAITEKPDLFLICGDVFDRVKPSNEAKIFLVRKAKELHDAGIQLVVIGGNHEIPKFDSGPMAIELLNSAGLATVFARSDAFESRKFHVGTEDVIVAGKSYFAAKESYNPLSEPLALQKDADYLVVMIHGSLNGMGVVPSIPGMASQNPFMANDVPKIANYLALGHFHNTFERQISEGPLIGNPGSIERLTKAEASEQKGFYWLELTDSAQLSFEKLPSRPMEERTIDVSSDMSNLRERIVKAIENWINPEKILDVRLIGQTTADEFLKLRPNEIYEKFHDSYFSLYIDRSQLQVENVGPLITEEIGTPIETYRKRLDLQIETATDEQTKQFLKLIKDEGCKYLGDVE